KFLVSVFGILTMFLISVVTVNAETKEEIQSKKAEVQSEITDKEKEIAELAEELIQLNESLDRTEKAIEDNQQVIDEVEQDIQVVEEKMAVLEEEIEVLQQAIDKRNDIMKKRIASLQENGGSHSYIEVLLGADNFLDFIERFSLVNSILESDEALMKEQKDDQAKVEEKQTEFNTQLVDLQAMKTEYEEMQRQVLEQKEQYEKT